MGDWGSLWGWCRGTILRGGWGRYFNGEGEGEIFRREGGGGGKGGLKQTTDGSLEGKVLMMVLEEGRREGGGDGGGGVYCCSGFACGGLAFTASFILPPES
jgi:hypothetical protein